MDGNTFMGLLIAAIGSLLAIISVIVALIIKPIINLNKCLIAIKVSHSNTSGLLQGQHEFGA